MDTLWRVVQSMKLSRAGECPFVTGDTKVVDRGKGDGIFINTAGIGAIEAFQPISPAQVKPGDAVLLNGDIGRHGIAIMACAKAGIRKHMRVIARRCPALSWICWPAEPKCIASEILRGEALPVR
jgi:hydrogenase maturation factor